MTGLIWAGVAVTVAGVAGLLGSALGSLKARRMEPEAARAHLGRLLAWNLGSVFVGVIGLMMVIAGLVLR